MFNPNYLYLLFISIFIVSCQNDDKIITNPDLFPIKNIQQYNWSKSEANFFNINNRTIKESSTSRDGNFKTFLRQEVFELYKHIVSENERDNFVDQIVSTVGTPIWTSAYLMKDRSNGKQIILLPFSKAPELKVSGLLTAYKDSNGFVINAVNRNDTSVTDVVSYFKKTHAFKYMDVYDKYIFDLDDRDLEAIFCAIKCNEFGNIELSELLDITCTPVVYEQCSDNDYQITWIGGLSNAPPHLDHDQDGILNKDDQDFWHQLNRLNLTEKEFQDFILKGWELYLEEDYGEYEDFWETHTNYLEDNYYDKTVDYYTDFYDRWNALWEDLQWRYYEDWLAEQEENDDCECPDYGPFYTNKEESNTREINCICFFCI